MVLGGYRVAADNKLMRKSVGVYSPIQAACLSRAQGCGLFLFLAGGFLGWSAVHPLFSSCFSLYSFLFFPSPLPCLLFSLPFFSFSFLIVFSYFLKLFLSFHYFPFSFMFPICNSFMIIPIFAIFLLLV